MSNQISTSSFFSQLPNWSKGLVFALTTIPVAVAISGQILGVQVGTLLEKYADIQFEQMRGIQSEYIAAIDAAVSIQNEQVDKLVTAMTTQDEKFVVINQRLDTVESTTVAIAGQMLIISQWACSGLGSHPAPTEGCPK